MLFCQSSLIASNARKTLFTAVIHDAPEQKATHKNPTARRVLELEDRKKEKKKKKRVSRVIGGEEK